MIDIKVKVTPDQTILLQEMAMKAGYQWPMADGEG
jgi:hypothetical protein